MLERIFGKFRGRVLFVETPWRLDLLVMRPVLDQSRVELLVEETLVEQAWGEQDQE